MLLIDQAVFLLECRHTHARMHAHTHTHTHMDCDCAVEDDGPIVLVIDEWVGKCTVRLWKSRPSNNYHMARHWGRSTDYPPHINDGTLINLHNEWI